MGQKIHPTGFRLSVTRNFAKRYEAHILNSARLVYGILCAIFNVKVV